MKKTLNLFIGLSSLYSICVFAQTPGMNVSGSQQQNVSNIKGVSIYMPGYQNQNNPNMAPNNLNAQSNSPQMTLDSLKQQTTEPTQKNIPVNEPTKPNQPQEVTQQIQPDTIQKQPVSNNSSLTPKNNKSDDNIISISEWNNSTLKEFESQGKKNEQKKYREFLLGK